MKFLIKQHGPNHWYFVLLGDDGQAEFVCPVKYNSAEEARRVVLKLRGTDRWTPIDVIWEGYEYLIGFTPGIGGPKDA